MSTIWLTTSLCIARCERGTPAMRSASASVAASSSAAGTERLASPHSAACVPVIGSPVNITCLARAAPRRKVHIAVVGQPQTRVGM